MAVTVEIETLQILRWKILSGCLSLFGMQNSELERCSQRGVAFLRFPHWDAPHAFSLRHRSGEAPLKARGNLRSAGAAAALLEAAGLRGRRLVLAPQRHTSNVLRLRSGDEANHGHWDALISERVGWRM